MARSLFVYGLSAAVPGLAALAATPVFTRLLSKQAYSQYVLALVTIAAASAFNSSVAMSVLRLFPAAEKAGHGRRFFALGTRLSMASASAICLLVLSLALVFGHRAGHGFVIVASVAAVVFLLTELANVLLSFVRIAGRGSTYLYFKGWQSGANLVAGAIITAFAYRTAAGPLLGTIAALMVGVPFLWMSVVRATRRHAVERGDTDFNVGITTGAIAAYGVPLMVAELAAWGLRLSDRWMLEAFAGGDSVATYSAAYTMSEASILIVTSVFQLALRPMEVRVWEEHGTEGARRFATDSTRIFLLMALPVAAIACALARPLFKLAVPPAYLPGADLVPWVVFSGVLLGLQHRFQIGIVVARKTERISYAAAAALVVNVSLNILFMPRYGMYAAAVTTFIGYGVFCAGVGVAARGLLPWRFPVRSALVAGLGALAAFASARGLMMFASEWPVVAILAVGGTIGVVAYGIILLLFEELRVATLRSVIARAVFPRAERAR
jgi:O-antigen/teichoic acid export membrane protein